MNSNFPSRTPLSAKNRYGLLQRRQGSKVEYSPNHGPPFDPTHHGPSTEPSQSSLPAIPSHGSDMTMVSAVHSGTQLPPIHHPFPFDVSRNITPVTMDGQEISANPAVLSGSTFWPMGVTGSSELPRRFLDIPQSDTNATGNSIGNYNIADGNQSNKVLHVTVSCNAGRLEEVMHNISKNMSELMVTGGVQRVQYSVD